MRVGNSKRVLWEDLDIDQCTTLSLADMGKHENLLIAASYFWSDALNAFHVRQWADDLHTFGCDHAYWPQHISQRQAL
jgi:hypothetical protein